MLPEKIELSRNSSIYEEISLAESCGLIIYKISDSTVEKINKQGLFFFKNATIARGLNSKKLN